MTDPGLRHKVMVYVEWYLPAGFPYLLIALKWLVLRMLDRYSLASTIVDVPFAAFTFDLWAITTKLQGRPLRPGERLTPTENTREGIFVVVALVIHLIIYLFSVWAWLGLTSAEFKWGSGLAMTVGALIPLWLLGSPDDRSTYEGAARG